MTFNEHSKLEGLHSFLSPSSYYWLNYDETKLRTYFTNHQNIERGTRLHAFAAECIKLKQKLPKVTKTLNMYVNDALGFNMSPEVTLFYSDYCFGHADAISFDNKFLRIHDYKSGMVKADMKQLMIYAALFCLEYGWKPEALAGIELRIYQYDKIEVLKPEPAEIEAIMRTIVKDSKILEDLEKEERQS